MSRIKKPGRTRVSLTAQRIPSDNADMLVLTLGALLAVAEPPLEDVVITARRRAERLVDVAASVSRLSKEDGVALDLGHAASTLNGAPGVQMQRGSGQESLLAIRSPVLTGAGACGAFLLLEDGFALRPTGFCNINQLFEANTTQAAAIEIIRGPGSVVHGANAVHGVINVLTPTVADLRGRRLTVIAGTDNFRSFSLAAGGDQFAAQGLIRHDGGFRADSAVTEYKGNLLHDRELHGGQLRLRFAASRLDQDTAGFIRGFDAYRDSALRRTNPNPEAFRDATSQRLSAAWTRADCTHCSDELRGILRHSSMTFLQHFLLGKPLEQNAQTSIAFAAARSRPLGTQQLQWQVGIDVEWAATSLLEWQAAPTTEGSAAARAIRPAGKHYDYDVAVEALGASASLEQRQGDWLWRAALRADRVSYRYDNRMRDGNTAEDGTPCPGGCLYSRPADRSDAYARLAPRLELIRHLGAQHLYVTLGEGFRPPEITELYRLQRTQSVAELDSERLRNLELGWRFGQGDASPSSTLRGNLALYSARKSDVILRDANGFNVIGGRTRHEGVEYDILWRAHSSWQIAASGSLARHRYDFSRSIEGGETITRGLDIDTAPHSMHRLEFKLRPRPNLVVGFAALYTGPYYADAANQRRHPGQTTLNLRGRWQASEQTAFTLEIENLADRSFADRADFAQGDWRYFPARRRSAYAGIEWRLP